MPIQPITKEVKNSPAVIGDEVTTGDILMLLSLLYKDFNDANVKSNKIMGRGIQLGLTLSSQAADAQSLSKMWEAVGAGVSGAVSMIGGATALYMTAQEGVVLKKRNAEMEDIEAKTKPIDTEDVTTAENKKVELVAKDSSSTTDVKKDADTTMQTSEKKEEVKIQQKIEKDARIDKEEAKKQKKAVERKYEPESKKWSQYAMVANQVTGALSHVCDAGFKVLEGKSGAEATRENASAEAARTDTDLARARAQAAQDSMGSLGKLAEEVMQTVRASVPA